MIIDANVAVYWAVPGAHTAHAALIMKRPDLSAPGIIIAEVANTLINPLATADRRLAALAEKLSIDTELIEPAL